MDIEEKIRKRSPRVERIMRKQGPLEVENTKKLLAMRGHHTSQVVVDVLRDLVKLSKPHARILSRKNEILPFEDANSIEFLCGKNDTSLFALGNHTKKRPHNLILGRTFDGHVLDMIELGVENFESMAEHEGMKKFVGSKPALIFLGDLWNTDSSFERIRNFFIDFFRGDRVEKIHLKAFDHAITFAVAEGGKIYMRGYSMRFLRSGTKCPLVDMSAMGPNMDLTLRRRNIAGDDMWKAACKQPESTKEKKVKNVTRTALGDKVGRIHMKRQNLDKIGGKRMAALRNQGEGEKGKKRDLIERAETKAKRARTA